MSKQLVISSLAATDLVEIDFHYSTTASPGVASRFTDAIAVFRILHASSELPRILGEPYGQNETVPLIVHEPEVRYLLSP